MWCSFRSITAAPRPGTWWIAATLGAALVATAYGIDQFIQSCATSCRLMHSGPFSWIAGLSEATWNGSFRAGVLMGLLLVIGHYLVLRPYLHQWRWLLLAALLSAGLGFPTALLAVLGVGGADFHFLPLELLIVLIAIGIATGCGWAMSWCYSAALRLPKLQRRRWVWLQTTSWLAGWMIAGIAVLAVWIIVLVGNNVYVGQGARLLVGWVIMWTVIAGVTGLPVRQLAVGQNDA
jgi:hypothetical protein